MAENKQGSNIGGNIGTGAGILAKRFQKSMSRAQEKVLQKLGKAMETKDEQFEQCAANLNKQQTDGSRLYKDVKAYYNAVKVMHETSKRLSQTLKDVYEPDWQGIEDLSNIMESEDLLWNDYEEKLNDQIVRTMENYTGQFSDVKERVAKRGRKLVDYDSARHHLESLQNAKKKDDAKIFKADEEFTKAQTVFEEINSELREELPVLYQSRIGCYVTVFQNISNLRDVFYKELSVLNHDIYNVMKTLETQHSTTTFVIKGLSSSSSKSRKSLTISAPVLCNTAFPPNHPALSKFSIPDELSKKSSDANSGSDEFGSSESFPSQHSGWSELEPVDESASGPADDQSNGNKRPESPVSGEQDGEDQVAVPTEESTPVSELDAIQDDVEDQSNGLKKEAGGTTDQSKDLKTEKQVPAKQQADSYPPGFLYKATALKTQDSDEGILLMFSEGDSLLVFNDEEEEKMEGCVWAVREEDWIKHKNLTLLSGLVEETLIQRTDSD